MDKSAYELQYYNSNVSNYASNEFLHINSCGISRYSFKDKSLALRQHRLDGRKDYHILYMVRGRKEIIIEGKAYEMLPGDAALYMPGIPQDYTFFVDEVSPVCESLYIHFSGKCVDEALNAAGLTKSCFLPSAGRQVGRLTVSLITDFRMGNRLSACGQLLRILPMLTQKQNSASSESIRRIHRQLEYIGIHFAEEIDLDRCAAREGLSRSRFSHLFTEYIGMSPYKYQLSLRLDKSKELLLQTSLPVSEVSGSVGFSDPLYFSRLFKKYFGVSPIAFRNKNK